MLKGEMMKNYHEEATTLAESFDDFEMEAILSESNTKANVLSKYTWKPTPLSVHFVKSITQPCACECFNIHPILDWATPIREFIETGREP